MPSRQIKVKSSRRITPAPATQRPNSIAQRLRWLPVPLALSGILCWIVSANLHSAWIALPWLAAIALWGFYFGSSDPAKTSLPTISGQFPGFRLLVVLIVAAGARWLNIAELPLGPSADEIFTFNNTIELLHRPFDLFGHTPLFVEGWVETAHLYLYFNLLILKLFGASYWSMKLFSVLPGIVACGAVFLIGRLIFEERVAFWTTLLFTFAHWPVRLSRYGWDVSFEIMTFAVAIWLLLLALQRRRSFYAYLSGMVSGVGLYSYLGARICVLSLLAFLFWQGLTGARREIIRHCAAFAAGLALVAFPLVIYYLAHPTVFWIRTTELSVFNSPNPLAVIVENIWRHALMFFVHGGVYARDNYPGLAMLDPLTGVFFIGGLAAMLWLINEAPVRLLACTLVFNFVGGIFSVSQEGAPYVYRTAAVMLPVFMISGLGLQRIATKAKQYLPHGRFNLLAWPVLLFTIAVNLYFYFGLEPQNRAAMGVMAYEPRLIGLEIARDDLPVFLVGKDLFSSTAQNFKSQEKYASANPPLIVPPEIRKLAVISFSGRYDLNRTLSYNFEMPENIYFVESAALSGNNTPFAGSGKIIFRSAHRDLKETIRNNFPYASLRDIHNIDGAPILTVATLVNPAK